MIIVHIIKKDIPPIIEQNIFIISQTVIIKTGNYCFCKEIAIENSSYASNISS